MWRLYLLISIVSIQGPEIGCAVKPDCKCITFSTIQNKEGGTFSSPGYPKSYPGNIDCLMYLFVAAPGQIVEITFADFGIQKTHLDCSYGDYLKLYPHVEHDEMDEYGQDAGTLCGGRAENPSTLYSSDRGFVLQFHSSSGSKANSSGFLGYYRFISKKLFKTDGVLKPDSLCNYTFTSTQHSATGNFYSPKFPATYPKNVRCTYNFIGKSNERIRILFEEIHLQKGDLSCIHREDVVRVYDGNNSASPVIAIFCNEGSAIEVLSSGSNVLMEFTSKSNWPGQGFKGVFQFQQSDPVAAAILASPIVISASPQPIITEQSSEVFKKGAVLCSRRKLLGPSCDAAFNSDTSKNGTFASTYYPNSYPPRSHCRFDFLGRGKERVQIVFHDFNLFHPGDDMKECDNIDSLQAFVYIDGRMEKIDSFCGSTVPKSVMSNGPRLVLEFRGISSSRYVRGFNASYFFLENFGITTGRQMSDFPCAFVYNSSDSRNGTFSSPNFPGPYPRDTECHYFFHGTNNEKVQIRFTYFDIEGVLPCEAISASDYVEFSNFMARDRKFNRHCGQLKEFKMESDRKFFRVTFRSNDRLDGTGFKADYQFVHEVETTTYIPNNGINKIYEGPSLVFLVLIVFKTF